MVLNARTADAHPPRMQHQQLALFVFYRSAFTETVGAWDYHSLTKFQPVQVAVSGSVQNSSASTPVSSSTCSR